MRSGSSIPITQDFDLLLLFWFFCTTLGFPNFTVFLAPMAEEKKHHFFQHNKDDEPVDPVKEEKHDKHLEEVGGTGAIGAGAFALHEKNQAKKDPESAHKHKVEEEIAGAAAVGGGGFAFHEHDNKKDAKKEVKAQHY